MLLAPQPVYVDSVHGIRCAFVYSIVNGLAAVCREKAIRTCPPHFPLLAEISRASILFCLNRAMVI